MSSTEPRYPVPSEGPPDTWVYLGPFDKESVKVDLFVNLHHNSIRMVHDGKYERYSWRYLREPERSVTVRDPSAPPWLMTHLHKASTVAQRRKEARGIRTREEGWTNA